MNTGNEWRQLLYNKNWQRSKVNISFCKTSIWCYKLIDDKQMGYIFNYKYVIRYFLGDFMGYEDCEHCKPLTRVIIFTAIVTIFISAWSHKESTLLFKWTACTVHNLINILFKSTWSNKFRFLREVYSARPRELCRTYSRD